MNRWIAALAMSLATAANAPAASPPAGYNVALHHAAPSGPVGEAEAATAHPAGYVMPSSSQAAIAAEAEQAGQPSPGPDPLVAWILAADFLGVIVLRRT